MRSKSGRSHQIRPAEKKQLVVVISTQCHYCGFETDQLNPGICPKCHGSIWERFAHPAWRATTRAYDASAAIEHARHN